MALAGVLAAAACLILVGLRPGVRLRKLKGGTRRSAGLRGGGLAAAWCLSSLAVLVAMQNLFSWAAPLAGKSSKQAKPQLTPRDKLRGFHQLAKARGVWLQALVLAACTA